MMNQVAAARETLELLRSRGMDTVVSDMPDLDFPHLEDMVRQMEENKSPQGDGGFSEGKLGRWLGWIQAAGCAAQCLTLEEAKNINMSHRG
jgi:hypothetical protein